MDNFFGRLVIHDIEQVERLDRFFGRDRLAFGSKSGEVERFFRPEFLNRLDEIILFHRLKRENMGAIVDIQLGRLSKLLEDRKITLDLTDKARDLLASEGYDPAYGARPLKRAIQQWVETPLARDIVAGRFSPGDSVLVDARGDEIVFQRKAGNQSDRHA